MSHRLADAAWGRAVRERRSQLTAPSLSLAGSVPCPLVDVTRAYSVTGGRYGWVTR